MLDLDAPSLKPGSGKTHGVSPDADARARAKAVEMGAKWKCSRVGAWVDVTDCLVRYTVARDAQPAFHSPCLECSSIAAHIRKIGGIPEPQPQQKETSMGKPAKKGTPSPVEQEIHERAKLEVVAPHPRETKPVVCQNKGNLIDENPFAEWEQYRVVDRYRVERGVFATLVRGGALAFSSGASIKLGLIDFASVDIYFKTGKLGLHFRPDEGGQLKLTKRRRGKDSGVYISSHGIIKHYGLGDLAGKRLSLTELGIGFVEISLEQGVEA